MTTQPEKLQRTPLKVDIEQSFITTSKTATSLRNMEMCKCPGNKKAEFRSFVTSFNYLFEISRHKSELSSELIDKCDHWFNKPKPQASLKQIIYGLDLYKLYSKELFDRGVLVYG